MLEKAPPVLEKLGPKLKVKTKWKNANPNLLVDLTKLMNCWGINLELRTKQGTSKQPNNQRTKRPSDQTAKRGMPSYPSLSSPAIDTKTLNISAGILRADPTRNAQTYT